MMMADHYRCPRCRRYREIDETLCTECAAPDPGLSAAVKAQARKLFDGELQDPQGGIRIACMYCGGLHDGPGAPLPTLTPNEQPCPRIRRIERHLDGTVLVLEFWPPGTWEAGTVFPRDVNEDDEGEQA